MRRVTIAMLVCGMVFGILSTVVGPKMIAYWYAPPVPAGAASAFNCTDAVQWAMNKLVWTQIIGTLLGLVVGLVLGILMRSRRSAATPPPPATKAA